MAIKKINAAVFFSAVSLALVVSGCGDKSEEGAAETKDPSQVAAKVNDTELTVHQVNFAMQRAQNVTQDNAKAVSVQLLRSLVDQELAAQQALKEKLDRDPMVLQAMDAARRQVLAEVYISRKLGAPVQPSDAEIVEYYKKNPEIFAERKVYQLREVAIKEGDEARKKAIRDKLATTKNLDEFGKWLQAGGYEFKATQGVKAAEQLPRVILPKLSQMPPGQAMIVNAPDGLAVLILAGVAPQPIDEAKAKPVIARLLATERRTAAIKAEIDALKAKAKVEYLGEFADAGKVQAAVTEKPAAPAAGADKDSGKAAIEKGLSGL